MKSVGVSQKVYERLKELGNLSMSKKIEALVELCEKHEKECLELLKSKYAE
jgi:predicted CopG family antitoxin